jgi:hypothetical protein
MAWTSSAWWRHSYCSRSRRSRTRERGASARDQRAPGRQRSSQLARPRVPCDHAAGERAGRAGAGACCAGPPPGPVGSRPGRCRARRLAHRQGGQGDRPTAAPGGGLAQRDISRRARRRVRVRFRSRGSLGRPGHRGKSLPGSTLAAAGVGARRRRVPVPGVRRGAFPTRRRRGRSRGVGDRRGLASGGGCTGRPPPRRIRGPAAGPLGHRGHRRSAGGGRRPRIRSLPGPGR